MVRANEKSNRVGHTQIYAWGVVHQSACCKRCSRTSHKTVRPKLALLVEARFSPRIPTPLGNGSVKNEVMGTAKIPFIEVFFGT
jgi:hypothetical protein